MEYKGYTLEPFQEEAINAINNGNDVIVATHTGNGKTLVADYIIDKCMQQGKTVIYTAPIKALSNQKYREMVALYGENNVGLVTGDIAINQNAPVLLVTTEILRNIIHENPKREILENLAFIILDEIHYINDRERGTVWEEIIIFRDPKTKILGLSATVPNAEDISNWMESISGQPCKLIKYDKRIVEQTHNYYDKKSGAISYETMENEFYRCLNRGGIPKKTTHIDFIRYAKKSNLFPVLFFVFSRRGCETYAEEAAFHFNFLTPEESDKVKNLAEQFEYEYPELMESPSWQRTTMNALHGICCHHAGLLPLAKRFVETLFENKLCKILYATETFAVGINFPVKTVCFISLRKFDGLGFRNLNGSEYLQMAGRAGRRGYDPIGKVFALANYDDFAKDRVPNIELMQPEPVKSQFNLSYNTVINLTCNYGYEDSCTIFEKGLSDYQYNILLEKIKPKCKVCATNVCPAYVRTNKQLKKEIDKSTLRHCPKEKMRKCQKYINAIKKGFSNSPAKTLEIDFKKKLRLLQKLSYMEENGELNARGNICKYFHIQELFLTELIVEKDLLNYPMERFMGIIGGLCFDGRDDYPRAKDEEEVYKTMNYLITKEYENGINPKQYFNVRGYHIVRAWLENKTYDEIACMYDVEEGDFVSIIRRTIDVVRQIKLAFGGDEKIVKYLNTCIKSADKGIVEHFM